MYFCSVDEYYHIFLLMKNLISVFAFFLFVACSSNTERKSELLAIDALLSENKVDSASIAFDKIDTTAMMEEEQAYYYLLETYIQKRQGKQNGLRHINKSIAFYEKKSSRKRFLGRAYLYKANVFSLQNVRDSAVYYLKKAELIADNNKDTLLMRNVCLDLTYENEKSGNLLRAIRHSKHLLQLVENDDCRWKGYALDNLAALYYQADKTDSFCYYAEREIPYIQYQPRKEQPYFYNNVAVYYQTKGDSAKAEYYLRKGVEAFPSPIVYGNLAVFYLNHKEYKKADRLWNKAMEERDAQLRLSFMKAYANWWKQEGDMERYGTINKMVIELSDSLEKAQKSETIMGMQDDFDSNQAKQKLKSKLQNMAVLLVVFAAVGMVSAIVFARYRKKMRAKLGQTSVLIAEYEKRIDGLTKRNDSKQRTVKKLEKKVADLHERHDKMMAQGKMRYEEICGGGNVALWRKDDFLCFLEYYSTKDAKFIQQLSDDYADMLTPSQKFLLCLLAMGWTEEKAAVTMALSPGAMRTMRYRIKSRKVKG